MPLPSAAELTAVSASQVARLEKLLHGTDELVTANDLLRELLCTVAAWPDAGAGGGLRVEIRSSAAWLFCGARGGPNANGLLREAMAVLGQVSVVAGAGFEHYFNRMGRLRVQQPL